MRGLSGISQHCDYFNGSSSNLSDITAKCLQVEGFVGRWRRAALSVCWNKKVNGLDFLLCWDVNVNLKM